MPTSKRAQLATEDTGTVVVQFPGGSVEVAEEFEPYVRAVAKAAAARFSEANVSGVAIKTFGSPDALARKVAASIPRQHPVANSVGPVYTTRDLCDWLGKSREAIHKAVRDGRILGCLTTERLTVYPVWQFSDTGEPIPNLRPVLEALQATDDMWRAALWLAAPAPYLPDGMSAAAWLAEGKDPAPVLTAARDDAERWAA